MAGGGERVPSGRARPSEALNGETPGPRRGDQDRVGP